MIHILPPPVPRGPPSTPAPAASPPCTAASSRARSSCRSARAAAAGPCDHSIASTLPRFAWQCPHAIAGAARGAAASASNPRRARPHHASSSSGGTPAAAAAGPWPSRPVAFSFRYRITVGRFEVALQRACHLGRRLDVAGRRARRRAFIAEEAFCADDALLREDGLHHPVEAAAVAEARLHHGEQPRRSRSRQHFALAALFRERLVGDRRLADRGGRWRRSSR